MLLLAAFFAAPPLVGSTALRRQMNKQPLPMMNQLQESYDKGPISQAWITHLLETSKVHSPTKKQTLRAAKRNRGMWIWMPSQGYVSVPKQMQSSVNTPVDKQAKIFRYGR